MSSMKKDLKKKLEQCQSTIVKTRAQKKTAEAEAKAAEAELRASSNATENADLKKKITSLNKEVTDLTSGCEELEKELATHQRDLMSMIPEEVVQMDEATLSKLAALLSKQPSSTDAMMGKFSEIYSHQRKTDIPLYDGIVSKEKLIEDWFREAERVARTSGWNDEQKLRLLSDRLSMMALRFHEDLMRRKPHISYQEWKREMKKGFKNDAEIERRKKELTNFKQTPSHRVREFISLIDEQYIRAYGKKLAESRDPDVSLLRDNTKKDIVYKGLLPPIAEELWHRTSSTTTYAELIALAGEVEEILSRKALLQNAPMLKMNHIEARESMRSELDREFDGLTIDELTSSSTIEPDSSQEEHPDSLTYAPVIRWMKNEPRVDKTSVYSIYAKTDSYSKPKVNDYREGLKGNPNNYRSGAKPDTPPSRHSSRPDYPQGVRPKPQDDWKKDEPFQRPQATEESSSRPWMLRRSSGHQTPSSSFRSNDLRRQPLQHRSTPRWNEPEWKTRSLPKDYKSNNQSYSPFRSNRFSPYGRRENPFSDRQDTSESRPAFKGSCYLCGEEGHIKIYCPQAGRRERNNFAKLSE